MKRKSFLNLIGLGSLGIFFDASNASAANGTTVEDYDDIRKITMHIKSYHKSIRTHYDDGTYLDRVIEHSPTRSSIIGTGRAMHGRGFAPIIHDPNGDGSVLFSRFNPLNMENGLSIEEHENSCVEKDRKCIDGNITLLTFKWDNGDLALGCISGNHNIHLV